LTKDAGDRVDFNAELTSWLHSFTPAINMYLRNELKYKTDFTYNMFGPVRLGIILMIILEKTCVRRWLKIRYLHLLVQSGYYDGACDYFNAKYNMWQMDPSGN
jgi:hypothetical protein